MIYLIFEILLPVCMFRCIRILYRDVYVFEQTKQIYFEGWSSPWVQTMNCCACSSSVGFLGKSVDINSNYLKMLKKEIWYKISCFKNFYRQIKNRYTLNSYRVAQEEQFHAYYWNFFQEGQQPLLCYQRDLIWLLKLGYYC